MTLVLLLLAVSPGGTMYIKEAVALKAKPKGGPTVMQLDPGTEVIWEGPDKKNPSMHRVTVSGHTGYVPMTVLAPFKALEPIVPSGPPVPTDSHSVDALSVVKLLTQSTQEQRAKVTAP